MCCNVLQSVAVIYTGDFCVKMPFEVCYPLAEMQCVTVCCRVLQYVAVCWSVLHSAAVCCRVCCSVLQCAAVLCTTEFPGKMRLKVRHLLAEVQRAAMCCSVP